MKDNGTDGNVNVGKNEVHCTVCGALQGVFSGEGDMKCIRCGRELRFKVRDEEIVLSCKRKKG